MKKQQSGFTLIELIMVIVILGILSAFALPRFADLSGDAQNAAVSGALGATKSASAIAHSAFLARGTTPVDLEGVNIAIINGYPAAEDICAAAQLTADFSCAVNAGGTGVIVSPQTPAANDPCFTYTEATATAAPVISPQVGVWTAGACST